MSYRSATTGNVRRAAEWILHSNRHKANVQRSTFNV